MCRLSNVVESFSLFVIIIEQCRFSLCDLIRIDGLEIFQKRWTQEQLMDAVIQHYKSGALSNVYKFILGIDLLGNPSKLIGGFGSGLSKLVTEPFQVG